MKTIILLGSLALVATTFACAGAPDSTGEIEQRSTEAKTEGAAESGGKQAASTGTPDGGTASTGKTGKGEPTPVQPADPTCVSRCNEGLKTKCQEDDTFCAWLCETYPAEQIACLAAAPSCEKAEWIRCMPNPETGDDTGTGGKK
jgi:hypothetical protein